VAGQAIPQHQQFAGQLTQQMSEKVNHLESGTAAPACGRAALGFF
jgi:hypothetical protein